MPSSGAPADDPAARPGPAGEAPAGPAPAGEAAMLPGPAGVTARRPPAAPLHLLPSGPGWTTLLYKELLRFWKVGFQTIMAPVVTALLYLLIFSHVLEEHVKVYDGRVGYAAFLVPGLVMMSVLQNAFANSSSSLIQSKITGSMVFILLPPITPQGLFTAYVLAAAIRGLVVGTGVYAVTLAFAPSLAPWHLAHPLWLLAFAALGAAILGILGTIAGIWADKFDQLAAFQNFVILPLTFLSGVFYSIHSLPPFWQLASAWNPFFYMIDGFRYGFFGLSDVAPMRSLAVVGSVALLLGGFTLYLLRIGYKLRP
jgi:ABC-2 type transport system permease protein